MDFVVFVVVVAAVVGAGYWAYTKGVGPFKKDKDNSNGSEGEG